MTKSILNLPPILQEVWRDVYAARCGANGSIALDDAENHAWEAVRRANGGEVPGENSRPVAIESHESTSDDMVEALATIVAASIGLSSQSERESVARQAFMGMGTYVTWEEIELAQRLTRAWKGARAWGKR